MTAQTLAQTIQLIVAPVVVLSACAIFVGGLLSHYEAISARMRSMASERLEILEATNGKNPFATERLSEIGTQLPLLLHRHGLVHHSLLAAYPCILILVADMCVIALSALAAIDSLVSLVIAMFVGGILAMLMSVVFIAVEVRTSRDSVTYEVRRILRLEQPPAAVTKDGPARTKEVWKI